MAADRGDAAAAPRAAVAAGAAAGAAADPGASARGAAAATPAEAATTPSTATAAHGVGREDSGEVACRCERSSIEIRSCLPVLKTEACPAGPRAPGSSQGRDPLYSLPRDLHCSFWIRDAQALAGPCFSQDVGVPGLTTGTSLITEGGTRPPSLPGSPSSPLPTPWAAVAVEGAVAALAGVAADAPGSAAAPAAAPATTAALGAAAASPRSAAIAAPGAAARVAAAVEGLLPARELLPEAMLLLGSRWALPLG
ncbi:antifreeze protein Maxi-like [Delphinapterus leucas]|uniref:Antifreeze protein Maxi-like n=1 Tax=Delphinapterus leucas TaxID=9749 RepID=A0A7F8K1Q7_DELLE|nr:antifreeze protein Maxi-like [Delphinapterus leucas]